MKLRAVFPALLACLALAGCETMKSEKALARAAMVEAIKKEAPGDYYVGRRFYKVDYKFWGFVRRAGQQWDSAQLVLLNENQQLAPDRSAGKIGSDNNYEYKLYGSFSGDRPYEPASNNWYPEFVLKRAELLSVAPAPIYRISAATDPQRRIIPKPY